MADLQDSGDEGQLSTVREEDEIAAQASQFKVEEEEDEEPPPAQPQESDSELETELDSELGSQDTGPKQTPEKMRPKSPKIKIKKASQGLVILILLLWKKS